MTFDLAVLGGGPGGAACALEAARLGLSVALYDPAPPGADKPCGEGVMPSGVLALRSLGLGGLVDAGRPFAGLRFVVASARPLEIPFAEPGVAIRRADLSRALSQALDAAGVERVRAEGRVVVLANGSGGSDVAAPGFHDLEGSGGAAPRTRRRVGTRFGLRARFVDAQGLDRVEVHLGRGCEVYLTPLSGGEVNAALLFERPPAGARGAEALLAWGLARHPAAAARLGARVTPPAARALSAPRPTWLARSRVFRVGDAGGAVDPIVGCGVTIAVRTGVLAARAAQEIAGGADSRDVERRYAAAFRRETSARRTLASILRMGDAHPRLAAFVVGVLHRAPRLSRSLVSVAAGTSSDSRRLVSDLQRPLGSSRSMAQPTEHGSVEVHARPSPAGCATVR